MAAASPTIAKQATGRPTRKVGAGGVGGAVAVIVVYILQRYAHINIDATLSAAITTVVTFIVAYLTPPSPTDAPVPAQTTGT
jgi:putative flippase GtrA